MTRPNLLQYLIAIGVYALRTMVMLTADDLKQDCNCLENVMNAVNSLVPIKTQKNPDNLVNLAIQLGS